MNSGALIGQSHQLVQYLLPVSGATMAKSLLGFARQSN